MISAIQEQVLELARQAGIAGMQVTSVDIDRLCGKVVTKTAYDALAYLANAVPQSDVVVGPLRLLGEHQISQESRDLIPGCFVVEFGFVPIGAAANGDIFVLDCEEGGVYELSHDKYSVGRISPGWNEDNSDFLPDISITRENIIATAERRFDTVDQFLDFVSQQHTG